MLILIILLGILFVRRIQPIFIIGRLIFIVLLYSYLIYMIIGRYWVGYILVMVILRGVLVVFTYIVRLIPNERFERFNILNMIIVLFIIVGRYYVWIYEIKFGMITLILWNTYLGVFNVFVIGFLLIVILIVVWLRYMGRGALRVMYKYAWSKGLIW